METIERRALNRATLARQHLLERAAMPALGMIEQLVGLQAQAPNPPYFGLWTRLRDFETGDLADLLLERRAVRIVLMRGTVHLASADDALLLRPLVQPIMDTEMRTNATYAKALHGLDHAEIAAVARGELAERPLPAPELQRRLATRWPDRDPRSLLQVARNLLPLVQVPPRGIWGRSGRPTYATIDTWLGRELDVDAVMSHAVRRYLAAFGPASVMDMQAWAGLTRLKTAFTEIRDELVVFRDEHGRELFDLPDAPRPGPDVAAAPRFLPPWDNLVRSHVDRSRIISDEHRRGIVTPNGVDPGLVLVGGVVAGTWRIEADRHRAELAVTGFGSSAVPPGATRDTLVEEGEALLAFAHPDVERRSVRLG